VTSTPIYNSGISPSLPVQHTALFIGFMDKPSWWRKNKGAPTADGAGMRNKYDGFTLKELVHLGAFPDSAHSKGQQNNLGSIHPIFAQDNWEEDILVQFAGKRKLDPLGKDHNNGLRDGYWTAHNPLVWKVLEPSLKLASKFVENAHIFPWVRQYLPSMTSINNATADFDSMTLLYTE
jgi:hypothetical protein